MFHGDDAEAFEEQKARDPYFYPYADWRITENFCTPKILTNSLLLEDVEDWSRVRSPSRARRRMKQGHPQNVRIVSVPSTKVIHDRQRNVMYCHPELYRTVKAHLDAQIETLVSRVAYSPLIAVLPETVQLQKDLKLDALGSPFDKLERSHRLTAHITTIAKGASS